MPCASARTHEVPRLAAMGSASDSDPQVGPRSLHRACPHDRATHPLMPHVRSRACLLYTSDAADDM
eukprot:2107679-Alexandrium_andersonii.AAC.1